eukprot:TRINITY_DN189_c0_g1_i1.p1 TRINITY_DN189_c0_g1~~TRINITY_DN189_c0_g1_i1.p1  ORF type:complete len:523 (+),score=146.68 TRINITY_DN189_c0_g1_i1:116-1570(+)
MSLQSRRIDIPPDRDVSEFIYEQGYSDGFPCVAPTEARVKAMLSGTARLPSEVLGKCPPNYGVATVEKVAIAAVMAGCAPSHFRVALAAVEAALDPNFNLHGTHATTMGATPCVIVNGPVRNEAGLNYKHGALGSGSRANATIGRTLKLVLQNVGGARLGGTESTTLGTPMKYTMCIAEWEERSQEWQPYHTSRGFAPGDSTVTVVAVSSGPYQVVDFNADCSTLLELLARHLATSYSAMMPMVNDCVVVISPEHYDTLRKGGVKSKEDLKQRLWGMTNRMFAPQVHNMIANGRRSQWGAVGAWVVGLLVGFVARVVARFAPRGFTKLPKFDSPDSFHIVVAGGPAGKFSSVMPGFGVMRSGPTAGLSRPASRKVERAPADVAPAHAGAGASERPILDPTGERKVEPLRLAPRSGKLDGVVGLLDISKMRGDELLNRLEQRLKADHPAVSVRRFVKPTFSRPAPESLLDEIARSCRFVVSALAD